MDIPHHPPAPPLSATSELEKSGRAVPNGDATFSSDEIAAVIFANPDIVASSVWTGWSGE